MFKLINLYGSSHFLAEEGRRKPFSMESVSLIISDMPYPDSFNQDELLKFALLWGKYDNIENEAACNDKVRWEFIKFYGVILAELRRLKPTSIPLLQNTTQSFCDNLSEDDVRRATAHCRLRAQVCAENGGSHFEHQLKKRRNMPVEE